MVNYCTVNDLINRLSLFSNEASIIDVNGTIDISNVFTGTEGTKIKVLGFDGVDKLTYRFADDNPDDRTITIGEQFTYTYTEEDNTTTVSFIVHNDIISFLNQRIEGTTEIINQFINYEYGTISSLITKYPSTDNDFYQYSFEHSPVQSVVVTLDDEIRVEDTDYWLFEDEAYIIFKEGLFKSVGRNPKSLKIDYTYGVETVPKGLRDVCIDMIAIMFADFIKSREAGHASQVRLVDYEVKYNISEVLNTDIKERLNRYQNIRFGGL